MNNTPHLRPAWAPRALTAILACTAAVLAGCGGSSGSSTTPPWGVDVAARAQAASVTAQSSTNACNTIRPFYWEVGDKTQRLAGASVDKSGSLVHYDADTVMSIASASKWLYAAYVAERRSGTLTAEDIEFLSFRSGYTNFATSGCTTSDTVASCLTHDSNGVKTDANVGKFYYNGGHMQVHASLAAPGMDLGALDNTSLAAEMRRLLGTDITLSYTQPQLAGGARSSANGYAVFLRKVLGNQLKMASLLGSNATCTNPDTCASAVYTPVPHSLSWHYAIGHWVEDDPTVGDGAFSSTGAFGFYPWIDAGKNWYGVVARVDLSGAVDSATCGALIRKAWMTGLSQ